MQLGTSEVLQNLLPIRRTFKSSQVRLQLATEDFQGSALSNTVGSDKTKHLTRARHGQSMQLETVGRVSMGHLSLEVRG